MPPKKKTKEKELEEGKSMDIEIEMEKKAEHDETAGPGKKSASQRGKMVTIQSRAAQPLAFSGPGFELQLSPFGTTEVPEEALVVGQLQRFISRGLIVVKTPPSPVAGRVDNEERTVADRRDRGEDKPAGERKPEGGE